MCNTFHSNLYNFFLNYIRKQRVSLLLALELESYLIHYGRVLFTVQVQNKRKIINIKNKMK